MSAKIFLDSNVLVYAFDQSDPVKRQRAVDIVQRRAEGPWAISWQVVEEFSSVALHRFASPMTSTDLRALQQLLLWPACRALPSKALHLHAIALHEETQFRFYDCLIIAAAIESGAKALYTEDLQHGRELSGVRLVNPFLRD
ncbi:MAG: PIN domain-containing protein [Chthoniobacterales bacterium]